MNSLALCKKVVIYIYFNGSLLYCIIVGVVEIDNHG